MPLNTSQAAFLRKAVLRWFAQRAPAAFCVAQMAAIIQLSPIADFKANDEDLKTTVADLFNRKLLKVIPVELDTDTYYTVTPAGVKAAGAR